LRIALRHLLKLMLGNLVFKRVQQGHAPLKGFLHRRRTGSRKRDSAQLFVGIEMMIVIIGQ